MPLPASELRLLRAAWSILVARKTLRPMANRAEKEDWITSLDLSARVGGAGECRAGQQQKTLRMRMNALSTWDECGIEF